LTTEILIKGGSVIDPATRSNSKADIAIKNGLIEQIEPNININPSAKVVDANNLIVCPGFVDLHCHLREPGEEHKETIKTGSEAAAAGGFTTVCAMPNTVPTTDNRAVVDYIKSRAALESKIEILVIGAVTKGSLGKELSEMGELAEAGVIAFSDDGNPVYDANIMRQALEYSSDIGLPIINHCEVPELANGASMNESWVSNILGLKGMPKSAEEVMVARDISLAKLTDGHVHIAHISSSGTLDLIRQGKEMGINVTCEVTPHHLTLTDEAILGRGSKIHSDFSIDETAYDTRAKVNPPLRQMHDTLNLVEGLKDGTIDIIATDHAPHSAVDKICTFNEAAFGISVLETAFGSLMSLVHNEQIELGILIEKLTLAPAKLLNMDLGSVSVGSPANLTIFDPNKEWTVNAETFKSKGKNTPLDSLLMKGQISKTIYGGKVIFEQ